MNVLLATMLIGLLAEPQVENPTTKIAQGNLRQIEGAWEICGSSPAYVDTLDPRGTPNLKVLFKPEGRMYSQLPDKTMSDKKSLDSREYTYRDGVLSWRGADALVEYRIQFLDKDTFRAGGKERSFLYCRLGEGATSFDKPLLPQSIDYILTSHDQDRKRPIQNPKRITPPEGRLSGTWELVRITTKPGPESMPPYGMPAVRVVIDRDRLCFVSSDDTVDTQPKCTKIKLDGSRVVVTQKDAIAFARLFDTGKPLQLNDFGGLSLSDGVSTLDFIWVGPQKDPSPPVPARLVLFNLVE
jgi:hypothetical protein